MANEVAPQQAAPSAMGDAILASRRTDVHEISVLASAFCHFAVLAAALLSPRPLNATAPDVFAVPPMSPLGMTFIDVSQERVRDDDADSDTATDADGVASTSVEGTPGREGSMGEPAAQRDDGRFGVMGPPDNPDAHLARHAFAGEATRGGVIGMVPMGGDRFAPRAPWGRDDSLGTDPTSALGHMWGAEIAPAFASGGTSQDGFGNDWGGGLGAHGGCQNCPRSEGCVLW